MTSYPTTGKSQSVNYSLEDIAALRELFKTLANGVKAVNQYPARHPIPSGFKDVFREKLGQFFRRNQELAVEVTGTGVCCGIDEIMRIDNDQENIPRILHRDGIRRLRIGQDVSRSEINELFACLARCTGPDGNQADVVNLLWQAQLESISYEAVDLFADNEIKLSGEIVSKDFDSETRSQLCLEKERCQQECESLQQKMTASFGQISEFSAKDVDRLHQAIAYDEQLDIRGSAMSLLMEIYSSAESLQDQAAAIERLKGVLDRCLEQGRFSTLSEVVRQGRKLLESFRESPARKRGLAGFLLRCGDSIRLKMVTDKLNEDEQIDLGPVRAFLQQLGPDSLNNLIAMLGDLAHYPARRMLRDLLASHGFERIDIIGNAVFDSRWYLVRNIVWVLGETGGEKALTFLRRASVHTDERVRAEVIKALGKIKSDTSVQLLLTMLGDQSERVSTMAANELGQTGSPLAFAALQREVTDKNFSRRSLVRIRQLLTALIACDGARALGTIRSLLKQTTIFGKARLRQVQEAAVNSLQLCDDPAAREFLEQLSEDKKSALSTVARRALLQQRYQRERSYDDAKQ